MMRTSCVSVLTVLLAAPVQAQWSGVNFVDAFGDVTDQGARSALISPLQPMSFPYGDIKAQIFVNCDRGMDTLLGSTERCRWKYRGRIHELFRGCSREWEQCRHLGCEAVVERQGP